LNGTRRDRGQARGPMNIVAVVQARMGSTRLPGKVLANLGGDTVLARVVHRLRRATRVEGIVIATTHARLDEAIVQECGRLKISCFRGSEHDVLDRYYQAAQSYPAKAIVRITADCPLIDSELVDETISLFNAEHADYGSNLLPRRFPRGLDVEVFSTSALEKAWRHANKPYEREHVTPYFYQHPELFRLVALQAEADHSQYRWTVDTVDDLKLLRTIYAHFSNRDDFSWIEAVQLMEREPELAEINSHVIQKVLQGA